MPDRYGDDPADLPDTEWFAAHRRHAIDGCGLCDTDGLAGGFPCDHTDRSAVAARGMAAVRAEMGWVPPEPHGGGESG